MAKRGPKPKGVTTVVTAVRLSTGVRKQLENAADKNGRTLSNEVEARLLVSLDDAHIERLLGGRETFHFARMITMALRALRKETGHWWHEDPFTFEEAKTAIATIFDKLRPPGDPDVPEDMPVLEQSLSRMEKRFGPPKSEDEKKKRYLMSADTIKSLRLGWQTANDVSYIVKHADSAVGRLAVETNMLQQRLIGETFAPEDAPDEMAEALAINQHLKKKIFRTGGAK